MLDKLAALCELPAALIKRLPRLGLARPNLEKIPVPAPLLGLPEAVSCSCFANLFARARAASRVAFSLRSVLVLPKLPLFFGEFVSVGGVFFELARYESLDFSLFGRVFGEKRGDAMLPGGLSIECGNLVG